MRTFKTKTGRRVCIIVDAATEQIVAVSGDTEDQTVQNTAVITQALMQGDLGMGTLEAIGEQIDDPAWAEYAEMVRTKRAEIRKVLDAADKQASAIRQGFIPDVTS